MWLVQYVSWYPTIFPLAEKETRCNQGHPQVSSNGCQHVNYRLKSNAMLVINAGEFKSLSVTVVYSSSKFCCYLYQIMLQYSVHLESPFISLPSIVILHMMLPSWASFCFLSGGPLSFLGRISVLQRWLHLKGGGENLASSLPGWSLNCPLKGKSM